MMTFTSYKNAYTLPPPPIHPPNIHLTTPPEAFDLNFCLSEPPIATLAGWGTQVRLEPFIPSIHAEALFPVLAPHVDLFLCMSKPMDWKNVGDMLAWHETWMRSQPSAMLFVIYNTKPGSRKNEIAGIISYLNTSRADLATEIGFITIIPSFQRTHILTHSCYLLLKRAFDLPSDGGYGLRRVCWQANTLNAPSVNAALRLGFRSESVIRMQRIIPPNHPGTYPGRPGDVEWKAEEGEKVVNAKGGWSRDTALLAICCDNWVDGGVENSLKALVEKVYV